MAQGKAGRARKDEEYVENGERERERDDDDDGGGGGGGGGVVSILQTAGELNGERGGQ